MKSLFICYFGLREPLVQTQVLPYLRQINAHGIQTILLTFEAREPRWSSQEREAWRSRLQRDSIRWVSLRYHKLPSLPATIYDVVVGSIVICCLVHLYCIDVLHARGYVPAAMAMIAKKFSRAKLVFDIRGFMAEEYVDAGVWPAGGFLYRLTKIVEERLLAAADAFVVLTNRARELLFSGCSNTDSRGRPIEVIPCCVDFERFQQSQLQWRDAIRKQLGLNNRRVLVYLGALGGWYLTSEMEEFLAVMHQHDPQAFALIITQSTDKSAFFERRLNELEIPRRNYLVCKLSPDEVPRFLAAADLAFCFIKPGYSKLSSSPTKIAEYLASGLPVICNAGIGDTEEVLLSNHVGLVIREFGREAYRRVLQDAEMLLTEKKLREHCCDVAKKHFDLKNVAGVRYRRLYRRLQRDAEVPATI
jgi:glycosyltransferase involved in cell wall biosynthesis